MADSWPPKSPRAALLSSPSGRRKFQELQERHVGPTSPLKRTTTTPNLRGRSRQLLDEGEDEAEEDEETLQLQLAAIEAKLKLKKLQQSKARSGVEVESDNGIRPASSLSKTSDTRPASRAHSSQDVLRSKVEVPLSPTKRVTSTLEPRSPSRVLLGIDKGWTGSDVSLGRTQSARSASRLNSRTSKYDLSRNTPSQASNSASIGRPKSFSERMAEGRAQEVSREARKEELLRKRSSGFKLNAEEMESFRLAAEEAKSHAPPRSPTRQADSVDYGREAVMQAFHENRATGLKRSNTTSSLPRLEKSAILDSAGEEGTTKTQNDSDNKYGGDSSLYEPFSQLHLSNRVLPHSFLKRTFDSAEPVRIPWVLRNIISPDYELPSSITSDFVLFGIVASKSDTRDHQTKGAESSIRGSNEWEKKWDDGSQNEKKYMVMKLTDLVWTIDLYLFGTALPRYHRISPGTVVAILNPGIMPPKPGKKDTGQFSLTINSGGDTILEVGTARDLGFCKAIRKDGRQCEEWLDRRKSDFCDWHVDAQVRKTQAGRMGLNSSASSILSSNRLAPRGGRLGQTGGSRSQRGGREEQDTLTRGGARYDRYTQSTYYMVPSAAPGLNRNANGRPQSSLSDDPFLAAGTPSRELISKSERLRKRIAHEAKEREIARKLGEGDIGRSKSAAGGEYLRKRSVANTTGNSSVSSTPSSKSDDLTSSNTSKPSAGSQMLSHILSRSSSIDAPSLVNSNGKRSADDVHLSPIKKKAALVTGSIDGTKSNKGKKVTRFITEKGIREAGRESLPGPGAINDGNDDDDDLDIV